MKAALFIKIKESDADRILHFLWKQRAGKINNRRIRNIRQIRLLQPAQCIGGPFPCQGFIGIKAIRRIKDTPVHSTLYRGITRLITGDGKIVRRRLIALCQTGFFIDVLNPVAKLHRIFSSTLLWSASAEHNDRRQKKGKDQPVVRPEFLPHWK